MVALDDIVVTDVDTADPLRADIGSRDRAADERRHAERFKKIVADGRGGDCRHVVPRGEIALRLIDDGDGLEHVGSLAQREQFLRGERGLVAIPRQIRAREDDPIGLSVGERRQQYATYGREHRRRRADAQRQDYEGRGRE